MGLILLKRALRDLKAGWTRYVALSLLIIFSIFIVVSLMGAAVTVMDYTELRDRELHCEDGEFSVFVPLGDDELSYITDKGVTVEEMFFADYAVSEDQVLRVFKVREKINQISIVEGTLPSADDEAVLERRYSEVNGIGIGDKVKIGDTEFTVCGIGATPDYNTVVKKVTDSVVDSRYFGLLFVTPDAYDALYESGCSLSSEEYYYSFLLNDKMTEDELKSYLEDIEFDVDDIDDVYFQEYWDRMVGQKDELLEGIDELKDGAQELADGADELSDGIGEFNDGMGELYDAVPDLIDGIDALDEGAGQLEDGINAYTSGVSQVKDGAQALSDGASELSDGTSKLNTGATQFASGVNEFASGAGALAQSDDPYTAAVASGFAAPAQELYSAFTQIQTGIAGVNTGAGALSDGASQLYDGIKQLDENSAALNSGADALHDGTSELKDGAEEFADGIEELYDGSNEINDGAQELAELIQQQIKENGSDYYFRFLNASGYPGVQLIKSDDLLQTIYHVRKYQKRDSPLISLHGTSVIFSYRF